MADLIKQLREENPDMSIADILDKARSILMEKYRKEIDAADISEVIPKLKAWNLPDADTITLIETSKFTPGELVIWVLNQKEPEMPKGCFRLNWRPCSGASNK